MRHYLKSLCLALWGALVAASAFADGKDVTFALKNADMEQGPKYWGFDGTDLIGRNTKNPLGQMGYHGMNQGVQEAWHSNPSNPLGDGYVMQRVKNLPNGTYVFGAYAVATKQNSRVLEMLEDGTVQEIVWSNRDSINGVVLFANDAEVRVATDNPDLSERGHYFGHSSKFNVATQVIDGTIEVGLRIEGTNANYIVWDNATLYYFGDMDEASALDVMAEIDITKAAAIADTLVSYKMNIEILSNLKDALAVAGSKTSTAASLWDDSEVLFRNAGLARKSIVDYANLKKDIEIATKVYENPVWKGGQTYEDYAELLEEQLEEAEAAYEAAELDREGLTALRNKLNWYVGALKYDSLYTAQEDLKVFIQVVKEDVGKPGGYSAMQLASLQNLYEELIDTCDYFEDISGEEYDKELFNPNNLWPYVARVYAAIEAVKNNPISTEYTTMPIEIPADADNAGRLKGATLISGGAYNGLYEYTSPLYTFTNPVENFKITVKKAAGGSAFFTLSKLAFYDGDGNIIELTEDNVSSEYDHNMINPYSLDGQGVPGMLDDDATTYFHSVWLNSPAGYHTIDVTLPNGGYSAFSFQMISRKGQPHQFPGEIMINTPAPKREALETTLARAQALNAYSNSEVGFYANDFSYLTNAIAEVVAALKGYPSEEECEAMDKNLKGLIDNFEAAEDKSVNLPVPGKEYHIVSGFSSFYEKQFVEKAISVHGDENQLWWENANSNSSLQKFVFNPILENGEQYIKKENIFNSDGTETEIPYYAYTIKNVGTNLYIDSAFFDSKLCLVEEETDTVFLKSLGRGQWNIIVKGSVLHCGDHNSGNVGGVNGAYGGTWGVSSAIVAWGGGLDGASAWFIREMPELPLTQLVSTGAYKSECYHFNPANTITLTANKTCAFADLAIYDLYGNAIEAEVVVEGNKATITTAQNIVGCAFAFTNKEGVSSLSFNAFQFTAAVKLLQAAYDAAVAVAPVEGKDVMQYADLSIYNAALSRAEAMLEAGIIDDRACEVMIAELEAAVDGLVPNMPEEGKSYFILSALDKFEANHGYKMAIYTKEDKLFWAQENEYEWNRYWQFEPATAEELAALRMDVTVPAYYIKNEVLGKYIGKADGKSSQIPMASAKAETVPYTITSLQQGNAVAIAGANDASNRLHGAGHGEGKNKSGSIVYWNSGLGTSSAWTIVEAESYLCKLSMFLYDIDALTRESVNIPIEMENPNGVKTFKFDLYLPSGVTLTDVSLNDDRTIGGHVVNFSKLSDGVWRIEGHSTTGEAFIGSNGVIVNLSADVPMGVAEGIHTVSLRNIRMTLVTGDECVVSDSEAAMKVTRKLLVGDANDDGYHTMSDVVMTVNSILGITQENFHATLADVNGDGNITIGDVISILRMVLTGELPEDSSRSTARRAAPYVADTPTLGVDECVQTAVNRMVIPVSLSNTNEYTAFQMDVVLPAGVQFVESILSERAKSSHTIAWSKLSDGHIRVVAYALNNATFNGNEGTLLNLVLEVTSGMVNEDLTLTNGFFTTPSGTEDRASVLSLPMRSGTTDLNAINTSGRIYGVKGAVVVENVMDKAVDVYSVAGKLIKQVQLVEGKTTIVLPAGVYVINGNKVIVK